MLPLVLALASAAAPPDHPAPYLVEQVDASDIHVYDALGERVPTEVVLRAVAGDAAADQYQRQRSRRKAAAVGMWVAGGIAATIGTTGIWNDDLGPLAIVGAASTGAGFITLYAPRSNRLDGWTTEEHVRDGLAALSRGSLTGSDHGPDTSPAGELVDGLPSASGEALPVRELAAVLGDARTAEEWERWRRGRRRTRTGLLLASATFGVTGLATAANSGDPRTIDAGLATAAVGAGMALGGTLGFGVRGPRAKATAWFTPEELDEAIRIHNADPAPKGAVEPERTPLVTVAPTIAPGFLGLHGTF